MNRFRGDCTGLSVARRLMFFNLLLLCLVLGGCGRPKYVSTGAQSFGLRGLSGRFWIVRGSAISADGQGLGATENLLYVLMLCPGIGEKGYGSSIEQRSSYNRYSSVWDTSEETSEMDFGWDLRTDSVVLGGQRFERANGEVFTMVRRQNGKVVIDQFKRSGGEVSRFAILDYIKRLKADDPLFRDLRFAKESE